MEGFVVLVCALLGITSGVLAGYFLSFYVIVVLSIIALLSIQSVRGNELMLFIFPLSICFIVTSWIVWYFTGAHLPPFADDFEFLREAASHLLLK